MDGSDISITETLTNDGKNHFALKGRITAQNAGSLQRAFDNALNSDRKHIVTDMHEVTFLSSGGIRVLLSTYKIANSRSGSFFIERPSENVKNVLGMVALDEMLLK